MSACPLYAGGGFCENYEKGLTG